ncbi:excalibur calcium-binding domain-containing protein [TM7 phylum sp. oral taxon 349]|nr:excalibur calcium-binding domain-containing protein [TM7 phylum sp. oral taxon 349]
MLKKRKKTLRSKKNRAEQAAAAAAAAKKTRQQQIQQQRQRQAAVAPAATPAQNQAAGVFFRNCKEARAAGYSNMSRGTPGYREELDRDHDGIACER